MREHLRTFLWELARHGDERGAPSRKRTNRVGRERQSIAARQSGALPAHRAHVERPIARYQMLCRVGRRAERAFELAMPGVFRKGWLLLGGQLDPWNQIVDVVDVIR